MKIQKVLCIVLCLIFLTPVFARHDDNKERAYIDDVKKNLFEGTVLAVIYMSSDGCVIVKGDDTKKYIGIINERICEKKSGISQEMLIIIVENYTDVFYFRIIRKVCGCFSKPRKTFAKEINPELIQFYLDILIGDRIRIPSSKPLSKFPNIYLNFVYFGDEKIPVIDF